MTSTKDSDSGVHSPRLSMMSTRYGEVSGVQAEKIQRLRVNRVAIVQVLRVDHVIPYLLENGVLTEDEKKAIQAGKSTQDKARLLIDMLPSKGRDVDWYGNFRNALKNPQTRSSETKEKYAILVEFLDNTILPSQKSARVCSADSQGDTSTLKLPYYDALPEIQSDTEMKNGKISSVTFDIDSSERDNRDFDGASSGGAEKGMTDGDMSENRFKDEQRTLLKGFFHKWVTAPDNFTTLIEEPHEQFKELEESSDPEDEAQLRQEKEALEKLRQLEIVIALNKQHKLPEGFEMCMSSAAELLLSEPNLFHMYFKYFQQLGMRYNLNLPLELSCSFNNMIQMLGEANDDGVREHVVKLGFGLFDLLCQYGLYHRAETTMSYLVIYLSTTTELEAWIATWEAFTKLMSIRNLNISYKESDSVYNAAQRVAVKIKMMSFGKDLLDESSLFSELSSLMGEQGSISPCYMWAQSALQEVEPDNHQGIVEILCNATLAYAHKFNVKKAEDLAVHAVRYAKKFFGVRHPMYVQALLMYCQYSSEFRKDNMGIEVARRALEVCEKIYGEGRSILRAHAHQALAKALLFNNQFTDDEYINEAMKAWKMAIDVLPGIHPRLALFRLTLAHCLLWQANLSPVGSRQGLFIWAETEASGALATFKAYWGDYSLKVGQASALLGQIYTKMGQLNDAETVLQENVSMHSVAFPKNSHYIYLAQAGLGSFYKTIDKPLEALELLQRVVDAVDCGGVYVKWVHVCYDTLIELLNAINREKDAEVYQAGLVDWMKKNPKPSQPIKWEYLEAEPEPYEKFYEKLNSFSTKLKAAKKGLKKLKLNMLKN